jgi:hypothetical protein
VEVKSTLKVVPVVHVTEKGEPAIAEVVMVFGAEQVPFKIISSILKATAVEVCQNLILRFAVAGIVPV